MSKNESIKKRAIQKARELGKQYESLYLGYSDSSFAVICDALRGKAGIELVTPEEQDKIFAARMGFQGGIGDLARGSFGAFTSSCFCLSLVPCIGRKEWLANKFTLIIPCANVSDGIVDSFQ